MNVNHLLNIYVIANIIVVLDCGDGILLLILITTVNISKYHTKMFDQEHIP